MYSRLTLTRKIKRLYIFKEHNYIIYILLLITLQHFMSLKPINSITLFVNSFKRNAPFPQIFLGFQYLLKQKKELATFESKLYCRWGHLLQTWNDIVSEYNRQILNVSSVHHWHSQELANKLSKWRAVPSCSTHEMFYRQSTHSIHFMWSNNFSTEIRL